MQTLGSVFVGIASWQILQCLCGCTRLLLREFFVLLADSDIFSPHEVISVPSNGCPSNACSNVEIWRPSKTAKSIQESFAQPTAIGSITAEAPGASASPSQVISANSSIVNLVND